MGHQPVRHRLPGRLDVAQRFPQWERVAGLAEGGLILGQLLKEGSFLVGRKLDVAGAIGDRGWDIGPGWFVHGASTSHATLPLIFSNGHKIMRTGFKCEDFAVGIAEGRSRPRRG